MCVCVCVCVYVYVCVCVLAIDTWNLSYVHVVHVNLIVLFVQCIEISGDVIVSVPIHACTHRKWFFPQNMMSFIER